MRAASNEQLQTYESWDLTKPKSSPRSKLYRLEPIGLGTPRVESLSSYIERLAAAHLVSTRSLVARVIGPASNKTYLSSQNPTYDAWNSFAPATRALNGIGKIANDSVLVLEGLTLRKLRNLTMLRWRFVLSEKALSRATHAWCPRCYEERRQSGHKVYSQLLWTLVTVEVCPFHQTRLLTTCPYCNNALPILSNAPGPGYCSFCRGWLGKRKEQRSDNKQITPFQVWVATQMSELIAAAPNIDTDPPPTRITDFIPEEINNTCNGNVNEFARLVGVNNMTVYSWCYTRAVPQNDLILKVCFATRRSFAGLLTNRENRLSSKGASTSSAQTLFIRGFRRHTSGEVRRALLTSLTAQPPVSVRQVSDYLGYRSDFLYVKYPDLCRKISERHRAYHGDQRWISTEQTKEPDDETIERTLRNALEQPVPPSIQELGRQLGYSSRSTPRHRFTRKFPRLHKEIVNRRQAHRLSYRDNIERELKRILLVDPPLTLNEASCVFGYKEPTYLRKYFPDLCDAIVQRHAAYQKHEFNTPGDKLKMILAEREPISLRAAAARLGKNPAHLGARFPKVCKAISRRYRLYLRERSRQRKKEGASKIRATAFELHAKGIYPSAKTIVRVLGGPQALTPTETGEVLRKVRRNLKLHSP